MKVVILGFDGLEHTIVRNFNLVHIMQSQYGIVRVPEIYYNRGVPYTPVIWVSFITGVRPEVHGVSEWLVYDGLLDKIRRKPPLVWLKNKRKILRKLGIKYRPKIMNRMLWKTDLGTFFDVSACQPAFPVEVAGYGITKEYYYEVMESIDDASRFLRKVWEWHDHIKKNFFDILENWNYKLVMAWFPLVDLLGHVFFVKNKMELLRAYFELNKLVKKTKRLIDDNTQVLIVSDHGMKKSDDGVTGNHSEYFFWSIHIPEADFSPKEHIDFFPKIVEWCER